MDKQAAYQGIIAAVFAILIGLLIGAVLKVEAWGVLPVLTVLGIGALAVGVIGGYLLARRK